MSKLYDRLAIVIAVILVLVMMWGLICLIVWAITSPWDNQTICKVRAKALGSEVYNTTGWRSNTCYINIGKEVKVIKL